MLDAQDIKVAKRLARLVIEGGEGTLPEIRPALEKVLKGRSAADSKQFLKVFHQAVVRDLKKDTLTIESAQELSNEVLEEITAGFRKENERTLHVVQQITPELIAGIRVRLGDTVYDASLKSNLSLLASRIR